MSENDEARSIASASETESHKNYARSIEISHELEEKIYNWYSQCLNRGLAINESMFQKKAFSLCQEFGEQISFNTGWLNRWRRKYGVLQLPIKSETSTPPAEEFDKQFKKLMKTENISSDQVFICGETGLYYKMLPTNELIIQSEGRISGFNTTSNRVTIMTCCNASGSLKLPLLLVDKINKPRTLKTINPSSLPLVYRYQKTAWVDAGIFQDWFDKEFVPRVTKFLQEKDLPKKAILIIDNAPMHSSEEKLRCGNIRSTLLHINVPTNTRLINHEILADLKIRYRYRLLSSLLEYQDDEMDIMKRLASVNIKDVIFWLADAWSDVSALGIQKIWDRIWHRKRFVHFEEGDSMSALDLVKLCVQIQGCEEVDKEEVQDLTDKDDKAMYNLSDEEIIAMVLQNGKEEPPSEFAIIPKLICFPEAQQALARLIAFFETQEVLPEDLVTLNHLRNRIKSAMKVQSLSQ